MITSDQVYRHTNYYIVFREISIGNIGWFAVQCPRGYFIEVYCITERGRLELADYSTYINAEVLKVEFNELLSNLKKYTPGTKIINNFSGRLGIVVGYIPRNLSCKVLFGDLPQHYLYSEISLASRHKVSIGN